MCYRRTGEVSGDLTGQGAGWAGRKDGWSWLADVQTGLEWQEVGVGVGTGTAMQQRIISSTPCLPVRADSTAMRHDTNRGEQQNRDKEKKRTYILGLCYACTVGAWGWSTDYPILLEVQADD